MHAYLDEGRGLGYQVDMLMGVVLSNACVPCQGQPLDVSKGLLGQHAKPK